MTTGSPDVTAEASQDRFCSQCGHNLFPLDVPYISSQCSDCGKTVHFVRKGPSGITISEGERFTIPSGYLQISLDPAARGKLYRPGLSFLINQLFMSKAPRKPEDFLSFLDTLKEQADAILKNSDSLKDYDLESEEDAKAIIDELKKDKWSREWYAMVMGAHSLDAKESIEMGDARNAAWAAYLVGTVRGLTIVKERQFEQTLWRGYLANQVVYEAAAASAHTPGEAEAIKQLEPLFRSLDEATLHVWVEGNLPIGPRIGVKGLPEEVLRALAQWHLSSIKQERNERRLKDQDRREEWKLRIQGIGIGVTVVSAIAGAIAFFM